MFTLVPKSYSLFPYFCSTIEFNPYLLFEFLIFYHTSLFAFYTYMLSIHNNLSAGVHNVTVAYVIIIHGKAAV